MASSSITSNRDASHEHLHNLEKDFLGDLPGELMLHITESLPEPDRRRITATLRCSAKYLNQVLYNAFRTRYFEDVVIRLESQSLERFGSIAEHVGPFVKKIVIDTQSLVVKSTKTDAQYKGLRPMEREEEDPAVESCYWNAEGQQVFEDAISRGTITAALPLLTNLEEFHVRPPALGDELKNDSWLELEGLFSLLSQHLLPAMQCLRSSLKVLHILGFRQPFHSYGAPIPLPAKTAGEILSLDLAFLTKLALSVRIDSKRVETDANRIARGCNKMLSLSTLELDLYLAEDDYNDEHGFAFSERLCKDLKLSRIRSMTLGQFLSGSESLPVLLRNVAGSLETLDLHLIVFRDISDWHDALDALANMKSLTSLDINCVNVYIAGEERSIHFGRCRLNYHAPDNTQYALDSVWRDGRSIRSTIEECAVDLREGSEIGNCTYSWFDVDSVDGCQCPKA